MNRIDFNGSSSEFSYPKTVKGEKSMSISKECLVAHKVVELLKIKNDKRQFFMELCDLHSLVYDNDLCGNEVFLYLEKLLEKNAVYCGDEIVSVINNMFFSLSSKEKDAIIKSCRLTTYEAWRIASDSAYCIQSLFVHFVNEKEFISTWDCKNREWKRNY